MTKINKDIQSIEETTQNTTQSPINENESITDSNTTIQDSVESSTVNPTDTFISTDDSTTETLVEVDSANKTSNTKSKNNKTKTKTTTKGTNRVSKKPTKKKIDLSFFDEQEKLINTTKTYTYENGIDTIDYYPIFDREKIDKLIVELGNTIDYCKDNNIDFLQNQNEMYKYVYFLAIKYFTELYPHFEGLSVEKHIEYLNKLYKTGHFDTFIIDIIPEEELQKLMDLVKNIENTVELIAKDIALRNKKIDETIQSDLLKEKLKSKELIN